MLSGTVQHDGLTEETVERFVEVVLGDDELLLLELATVLDPGPPPAATCARGSGGRPRPVTATEVDLPGPTLHPPPIEPWARERSPPPRGPVALPEADAPPPSFTCPRRSARRRPGREDTTVEGGRARPSAARRR